MTVDSNEKKQRAAQAALDYVREGMRRRRRHRLHGEPLHRCARAASGMRVSGAVSSSNASTARLRAAGIEVMDLNDVGVAGGLYRWRR